MSTESVSSAPASSETPATTELIPPPEGSTTGAPGQQPPAAPKRRSIAFLASALASGNLIANLLRMLGGIFQARLIAPQVQGLFTGLSLIQGYAPFLQLGVLNGLNRELPYYVGKGDRSRVNELAAAAQAWALMVGGVTSLGVMVVAAWYLLHGRLWMAAGLATNAVLVFLVFYTQWYLQTTYRTGHDFARLALVTAIQWTIALVMVVPIQWIGFYGVCLRAVVPVLVSTVLLHRWRPIRVGPKWNYDHWKHLLRIGAPIFAVGQMHTWWILLDGTLVLRLMGTRGLGLYTLTIMAMPMVVLLPQVVAQIIYPRMSESYGRNGSLKDVLRIAVKPIIATVLGMAVIIPIGWVLAPPVVAFVAPMYVGGVPAMQWSLLIGIAMAISPITTVFNVLRRQGMLLVATLAGMATYAVALAVLMHDGRHLTAFPQAMFAGQSVYIVASYILLAGLWRRDRAERS